MTIIKTTRVSLALSLMTGFCCATPAFSADAFLTLEKEVTAEKALADVRSFRQQGRTAVPAATASADTEKQAASTCAATARHNTPINTGQIRDRLIRDLLTVPSDS